MKFLVSFLMVSFFASLVHAAPMANEITDLAYFPEQGRVQVSLMGGFDSTKMSRENDNAFGTPSAMGMGADLQALYSINNWVAAGVGVQFDNMSTAFTPGTPEGAKKLDISKNMGVTPSLVVAASALGAESDQPFAVNASVRFAPKWTKFAKPQGAMVGGKMQDLGNENSPTPKTNDLAVNLVASYKAHPMVEVALEGGYTKVFATKDDRANALTGWGSVVVTDPRQKEARNQILAPDVISAALRAQMSIQDKAFVTAGGEFERSTFFHGQTAGDKPKVQNIIQNDIRVALGVKAPVHEQVAVQVGGTYLVSSSAKVSDEATMGTVKTDLEKMKARNWGVNAGLVALF